VALTNRQIERYSRQIIVEGFGGVAQERLLASRVLLISNYAEAEALLAYLVGAGVGKIYLCANIDEARGDTIIARMRDLNSDSFVVIGDALAADELNVDLAIAIVGDHDTLSRARALCDRMSNFALVLARLDVPAKLAVIPSRPPCLQCANAGELLAPVGSPADNAGFIEMLAALEAPGETAGFEMPRHSSFCGRLLRHGDWGRDRVVRLVRRDKAHRLMVCRMTFAVRGLTAGVKFVKYRPKRSLDFRGRKVKPRKSN